MSEDWRDNGPLDKAAEMAARGTRAAGQAGKIAQAVQSAHGTMAAAATGGAAGGVAVGSALGGPLGAAVGALVTSRTFWKVIISLLLSVLLHEWITMQRYRPEKLMEFGVNYLEIDMFLDEIRSPSDIIVQQNAILALSYCPNLFGCEDKVKDTLMEICRIPEKDRGVCERAILCLLELGMMNEKELEKLIEVFQETDSSEVRFALYRSIRVLGKADEYIEFLTEGLKYACQREGRMGNESSELHYTMMEVEEPSAAMKIIRELADNKIYFHIYRIDKVIEHIFTRFVEKKVRFRDDKWGLLVEFYEKISSHGLHNLEDMVLSYFSSVGEKIKLCQHELKKVMEGKRSWIFIRKLLDDTVSKWV